MAFATIDLTKGITGVLPSANATYSTPRLNAQPLIINGDMALSQRNGNTATTIGAEAYSLDRWSFREISNGTTTVAQTTTVPSGKGFAKSLKVAVTGADTSIIGDNIVAIAQKLEGQDAQLLKFGTSDAQKVTISFWVRSNVTGTYSATLRHTNTSGTAYVNSLTFSISSGDTWEKKVLVFNANTSQDIRNTNTEGIRLEIILTAGSDYTSGGGANANTWTTGNTNRASASNVNILSSTSNTFYLTGVQMEVGEYTSATLPPFQHESFEENLQRCARYYQQIGDNPSISGTGTASGQRLATGIRGSSGSTDFNCLLHLIVPLRATPTTSTTNVNVRQDGNNKALSSIDSVNNHGSHIMLGCTADSGLTVSNAVQLRFTGGSGAMKLNAEL